MFLLKINGLTREQVLEVCELSFEDGKEVFENLLKVRPEVFLVDDTIDIVFDEVKKAHCVGNSNDKDFQFYITVLQAQYILEDVVTLERTYDEFIQEVGKGLKENND